MFEDARSFNCDLGAWTLRVRAVGVAPGNSASCHGATPLTRRFAPVAGTPARRSAFAGPGGGSGGMARRRVLVPLIERHAAYYWMGLAARPDAEGNAPRGAIEAFRDDF